MKKILIVISLFLVSIMPLMAQVDWEAAYYEEFAAHNETQMLYDDLQASHDWLQERHDITLATLEVSVNGFEELNLKLASEANYLNLAKEQIELDQTEIEMLRDSLKSVMSLADVKYFTAYFQGGLLMENPAFDLGLSVRIPRVPFSVMVEAGYVVNNGFGFKLGAGVRF